MIQQILLRPWHLNLACRILISFMAGQHNQTKRDQIRCRSLSRWSLSLREQQAVTKSKTKKPFVTFKDRHNDLPKDCASAFQGIDISPNHCFFSGLQYLRLNSYQIMVTVETLQEKNHRSTTLRPSCSVKICSDIS